MSRIYLLDTNIISYLTDSKSPHRQSVKDDSDRDKKLFESGIEFIKEYLEIFPLSVEEIDIFGKLKAKYKQETGINTKALKKNDLDFLIASTAISQGAVLVSNDGIFGDIVEYGFGLEFEEWV